MFPDGRLPSPRWRPVAIAAAASFAGLMSCRCSRPSGSRERFAHVVEPTAGGVGVIIGIPFLVCRLGALAGLVGGALAVRTRLQRSTGVEHLQVKWLAYAAALIPAAVVVCLVEIAITGSDGRRRCSPWAWP